MKIDLNNIKIHQFQVNEIDEYLEFINKVKTTMDHPEWLGDFTKEDLINLLNTNSYGFFFKYNNELIATSILIPARKKDIDNFELDIDYTKTMDYGPEAVDKSVQGNGIQSFIIKKMDEFSKEKGYLHAVTTIHPDNVYSIRNFKKNGFVFHKQKIFNRGIRNIYYKSV